VETGNLTVSVAKGNEAHAVGKGNFTLKCDLGKVTIEAMQEIELKVGENSIKIDQSGITMKSMQMNIDVKTALQAKALVVKQEASAAMVIKGAITMIN
jgi:type VI secretion system secreted protein VgrG